jgi:hypothetical protein
MLTSHSSNDSCALVSMEPIYVWSRPSFVIIIQAFIWIYRKYRCDVENKVKLLAASVLQITPSQFNFMHRDNERGCTVFQRSIEEAPVKHDESNLLGFIR